MAGQVTKDTLVIIPAYNEQETIEKVVCGLQASLPGADIVLIDDGSRDQTAARAAACGVIVLEHIFNLGYGAALQTGFKYALKGGYSYAVQLDADGQHEPRDVVSLLGALKRDEADMVIGSRFLGTKSYEMSWARKIGIDIFSSLASLVIRQKITDCTSGFKGFNRRVLPLLSGEFYPEDYPDADVIIDIHYAGFRIKEVPVTMYAPPAGRSMHIGVLKFYYIFKMFLSIIMTIIREKPFVRRNRPCR